MKERSRIAQLLVKPCLANSAPVCNLRTRAQALMLLGHREEALRELAESFAVDRENVELWYTIARDPVWNGVRETAEFRTLAAEAQRYAAARTGRGRRTSAPRQDSAPTGDAVARGCSGSVTPVIKCRPSASRTPGPKSAAS
jgi:hypothetical protein